MIKSFKEGFSQKITPTQEQEEKLESLYKEKSKFVPSRNYFSPEKVAPRGRRRPNGFA